MRKVVAEGKLQFRPSMARYTVAALVRVGLLCGFWMLVWLLFGFTALNILLLLALLMAVFVLSFIVPFLMFIDVEFGRIEGPDGYAISAISLDEVDWSRSVVSSVVVHIKAKDGRAVTADRAHFSAEEFEEIFFTFTGGNTVHLAPPEEDS